MSIDAVFCPGCSVRLRLPAEIPAGKRIRCPRCHSAFSLSTALAAHERKERAGSDPPAECREALAVLAEEWLEQEPPPRPERRRGRRRKRPDNTGVVVGLAVGAGVLVLAGFAVGLWLALRSGGGPTPQAPEGKPEASTPPAARPDVPLAPPIPVVGATGATATPELRAYLLAAKELDAVLKEVADTLRGVTDQSSAAAAAKRLAAIHPRLERTMKEATSRLLVVDASPVSKQQLNRMHIQVTEADAEFARRVRAELSLPDPAKPPAEDLLQLMVRAAKNPAAGPLRPELQRLRDTFLRGHAPAAPVTVRQRLERALGPLGSPLGG